MQSRWCYAVDLTLHISWKNLQYFGSAGEPEGKERATRGQREQMCPLFSTKQQSRRKKLVTRGVHPPSFIRHGWGWKLWCWAGKQFSTMFNNIARGPAHSTIFYHPKTGNKPLSVRKAIKCVYPQITMKLHLRLMEKSYSFGARVVLMQSEHTLLSASKQVQPFWSLRPSQSTRYPQVVFI